MYFNKEQFKRAEDTIISLVDLPKHINEVIIPANSHKYKNWDNKDITAGAVICPFHEDKDPSFSYEKKRNFAYCFGCHKGGNVIGVHKSFLNTRQGTKTATYRDALYDLAKIYGIEIPKFEYEDEETSVSVKEGIRLKLDTYKEERKNRLEKIKKGVTGVNNKQLKELNEKLIDAGIDAQCFFDMVVVAGKNDVVTYDDLVLLFNKFINNE